MDHSDSKITMSKIQKVILWLSGISITILILVIGLFYLLRNDILSYVIQSINELKSGEITAEQIQFSPFYQFPYISIELEKVSYFEKPGTKRDDNELPICNIQSFYLSLDIMKLVSGELNVSKITLEDGQINIVAYEDGSTNINNALSSTADEMYRVENRISFNLVTTIRIVIAVTDLL